MPFYLGTVGVIDFGLNPRSSDRAAYMTRPVKPAARRISRIVKGHRINPPAFMVIQVGRQSPKPGIEVRP